MGHISRFFTLYNSNIMKNLIYPLMLILATIVIYSCQPCPDCPEVDQNYTSSPQLKDTIPVDTFNAWVKNWKDHGQAYIADTLTKYFTLPTIDLDEFLQFPGSGTDSVAAARFAIGLEITPTYRVPHIMLLGVNEDGVPLTDSTRSQYIFDFSTPCPSLCDKKAIPPSKK